MFAFIDYRTSFKEETSLNQLGFITIRIPKSDNLYKEIDGHVDIQISVIKNSNESFLIVHKDINKSFLKSLDKYNIKYIFSEKSLEYKYPGNIILNGYINNKFFIHNLKYTDKTLLNCLDDRRIININQGYSKCSILPVNEKALITNDIGIYNSLSPEGFDVLLLPFGDIQLPDFEYGFIGGVGGKISENKLAFFGNLNQYKYGSEVLSFLKKHNVSPIYLRNSKLFDRGSLLVL